MVRLKDRRLLSKTSQEVLAMARAQGVDLQLGGPFQALRTMAYNFSFLRGLIVAGACVVFLIVALVSLLAITIVVLGRFRELGIIRAIGASPSLAVVTLIVEMVTLGTLAGLTGSALGVGLIHLANIQGIPAPTPWLNILFGGPRLFPVVSNAALVLGIVTTTLVAFLSTLYPVRIASRVAPVIALRGER
jgi:putative ABC transport system permease protein